MDFGLQIVPSACSCHSESGKEPKDWECRSIVIEKRDKNRKRQIFTTRTLTAKKENLNTWNLGVFAQPARPSMDAVQQMSSEFLHIEFASVAERIEFRSRFHKALEKRNEAEANCRGIIKGAKWLNERNGSPPPPPPPPPRPSRSDSMYSLFRLYDRPPVIRPLSPCSTFRIDDAEVQGIANARAIDDTSNVNDGVNGGSESSSSPGSERTTGSFGRGRSWIDRRNLMK